jgi:hypothetical protein
MNSLTTTVRDSVTSVAASASPLVFALEQNYPNPFNPSTRITYAINTTGSVSLVVYNALGQAVATLVEEKQPAGRYTVEWIANDTPSGVYFCRLTAEGQTATRKMLLVR